MAPQLAVLREAVQRLRAEADSLFLSYVADMLEREADNLESVPYMVDDDWIERNYRDPLGAARAYLDGEA